MISTFDQIAKFESKANDLIAEVNNGEDTTYSNERCADFVEYEVPQLIKLATELLRERDKYKSLFYVNPTQYS